jgi:hypothetical protein
LVGNDKVQSALPNVLFERFNMSSQRHAVRLTRLRRYVGHENLGRAALCNGLLHTIGQHAGNERREQAAGAKDEHVCRTNLLQSLRIGRHTTAVFSRTEYSSTTSTAAAYTFTIDTAFTAFTAFTTFTT